MIGSIRLNFLILYAPSEWDMTGRRPLVADCCRADAQCKRLGLHIVPYRGPLSTADVCGRTL